MSNSENAKKKYVKPKLEVIELRPEERIAANSGNCAAQPQGTTGCDLPSEYPGQNPKF